MGFSSTKWTFQHNRHHAMPQRLQHDVDLYTMPLLAYNAKVVKNSKEGKGFMIKNQVSLVCAIILQILCSTVLVYKGISVPVDRHLLDRCNVENVC